MSVPPPGEDGQRAGGADQQPHPGQLRLRRLRAGELPPSEETSIKQHLEGCADCRTQLDSLAGEERAFTESIPFARFAGGVERAARVPRRPHPSRRVAMMAGAAAAAAAGIFLVVGTPRSERAADPDARNRIKGGPAITATVRVAGPGGQNQRTAAPGSTTALAAGDRLRVGFALPEAAHLMVVSVDDAGETTKISNDLEAARLVQPATEVAYLDDSIELTGAGKERLYLFVSEFPLDPDSAADAARAAHAAARGDLTRAGLPTLPPRVRAFTWLFEKP